MHLYYFRKAQTKIAYLEGVIESKDKEIVFLGTCWRRRLE